MFCSLPENYSASHCRLYKLAGPGVSGGPWNIKGLVQGFSLFGNHTADQELSRGILLDKNSVRTISSSWPSHRPSPAYTRPPRASAPSELTSHCARGGLDVGERGRRCVGPWKLGKEIASTRGRCGPRGFYSDPCIPTTQCPTSNVQPPGHSIH